MNLFSLLDSDTVHAQINVKNKKELIMLMVESLNSRIDPEHQEEILEKVLEREKVMSTGVGKGLGIPHCKTDKVEENLAAFALLNEPLEFSSIDDEPVRLVFLLISPDSRNSLHIKMLSRISRLMNSGSFREQILSCTSKEEILDAFKTEEEKFFVS